MNSCHEECVRGWDRAGIEAAYPLFFDNLFPPIFSN
eukprot:gene26812-biopygen17398